MEWCEWDVVFFVLFLVSSPYSSTVPCQVIFYMTFPQWIVDVVFTFSLQLFQNLLYNLKKKHGCQPFLKSWHFQMIRCWQQCFASTLLHIVWWICCFLDRTVPFKGIIHARNDRKQSFRTNKKYKVQVIQSGISELLSSVLLMKLSAACFF